MNIEQKDPQTFCFVTENETQKVKLTQLKSQNWVLWMWILKLFLNSDLSRLSCRYLVGQRLVNYERKTGRSTTSAALSSSS